jgi:ribA/ribD-fused uncharacterized protein
MRYHLSWLIDTFDKGQYPEVILFGSHVNKKNTTQGEYMLSQWYPSPFSVNEIVYNSSAQWMMARKALLFGDREAYRKIIKADSPDQIKSYSRAITDFDEARWAEYKYEIVREGNFHKYNQNKKLRTYLLSTGNAVLAEANPFDKVWGIGLSSEARNVTDPYTWEGLNLLGFALMEIREYLRNFAQFGLDNADARKKSRDAVVF